MAANLYKVVQWYEGYKICLVNYNNPESMYYSVEVDGLLSSIALISVKACMNVIDTHIKFNKI